MNKKLLIGIGVIVVAATGYAIYKTLYPSASSASGSLGGKQWPGDYIQYRKNGKFPVHFASPRPKVGTFNAGDQVVISGSVPFAGTYNVDSVWIDGDGNIGAVYLPLQGYNATSNDESVKDSTFSNKFSISKL